MNKIKPTRNGNLIAPHAKKAFLSTFGAARNQRQARGICSPSDN